MIKKFQILSYLYWNVFLITLIIAIQNSGLVLILGLKIHRSQLMPNFQNSPWQYSKNRPKLMKMPRLRFGANTYYFSKELVSLILTEYLSHILTLS